MLKSTYYREHISLQPFWNVKTITNKTSKPQIRSIDKSKYSEIIVMYLKYLMNPIFSLKNS